MRSQTNALQTILAALFAARTLCITHGSHQPVAARHHPSLSRNVMVRTHNIRAKMYAHSSLTPDYPTRKKINIIMMHWRSYVTTLAISNPEPHAGSFFANSYANVLDTENF